MISKYVHEMINNYLEDGVFILSEDSLQWFNLKRWEYWCPSIPDKTVFCYGNPTHSLYTENGILIFMPNNRSNGYQLKNFKWIVYNGDPLQNLYIKNTKYRIMNGDLEKIITGKLLKPKCFTKYIGECMKFVKSENFIYQIVSIGYNGCLLNVYDMVKNQRICIEITDYTYCFFSFQDKFYSIAPNGILYMMDNFKWISLTKIMKPVNLVAFSL